MRRQPATCCALQSVQPRPPTSAPRPQLAEIPGPFVASHDASASQGKLVLSRSIFALALLPLLLLGCARSRPPESTPSAVGATAAPKPEPVFPVYAPTHPSRVEILVSLDARMLYVVEDGSTLLTTPIAIGSDVAPTPEGRFRVTRKVMRKRSYGSGFWVSENQILPGSGTRSPGMGFHYVGYPMPFWVEFEKLFGIYQGYDSPVPGTLGCIRLPSSTAPILYALVEVGTPLQIARSQPADAQLEDSRPPLVLPSAPPDTQLVSSNIFDSLRLPELIPPPRAGIAGPSAPAPAER